MLKALAAMLLGTASLATPAGADEIAVSQANKIQVKSCDQVVSDYQSSCLKSCETFQATRKTQCQAACNDSGQLRLRKSQCEASRKV